MRQILFLINFALVPALTPANSNTINDCQYNLPEGLTENPGLLFSISRPFHTLIQTADIFDPHEYGFRQNANINLTIDGSNHTLSYSEIAHKLVMQQATCNAGKYIEFSLQPFREPLSYSGEIFISQRSAGRYNVTFDNITISSVLNIVTGNAEDIISNITTYFNYESYDMNLESNPEDEAIIVPFVAPFLREIKSILRSYVTQEVTTTLKIFRHSLTRVINLCTDPFFELSEPVTPYSQVNLTNHQNTSYPVFALKVNSLTIEGLKNVKSTTYRFISYDYPLTFNFEISFKDLHIYIDWQYNSTRTPTSSEKLKFNVDELTIRGEYVNYGELIASSAHLGSITVCQQCNNKLSSLTSDILANEIETILAESIFKKYR